MCIHIYIYIYIHTHIFVSPGQRRPFATNCLVATVKTSIADLVVQKAEGKKDARAAQREVLAIIISYTMLYYSNTYIYIYIYVHISLSLSLSPSLSMCVYIYIYIHIHDSLYSQEIPIGVVRQDLAGPDGWICVHYIVIYTLYCYCYIILLLLHYLVIIYIVLLFVHYIVYFIVLYII